MEIGLSCWLTKVKQVNVAIRKDCKSKSYCKRSKYHCKCGGDGWVDMGAVDNRYPCRECYLEIVRIRNDEYEKS